MRKRKVQIETLPAKPAGPTTYLEVKRDVLKAVAELEKVDKGAAQYLRDHLIMDDEKQTFMYTGDSRLQMERLLSDMKDVRPAQPAKGDLCLHCGHGGCGSYHWFWANNVEFTRPDGSEGHAKWIVVCGDCFQAADGDVRKMEIKGDLVWDADVPIIGGKC